MIKSATYQYSNVSGDPIKVSINVEYQDGKIWSIPIDNENRHYQEVLQWVADGNTIKDS
tara:strand:+ start:1909 stop:2085 length:177 start_codon:yes stop_codon:yes gene_type:complete